MTHIILRKNRMIFMEYLTQLLKEHPCKLCNCDMAHFIVTGFVPISWLNAMFHCVSTNADQFDHACELLRMTQHTPSKHNVVLTPSRAPIRKPGTTTPIKKVKDVEVQRSIATDAYTIADHKSALVYTLDQIVTRMVAKASTITRHPSGCAIDIKALHTYLTNIFPSYRLAIDDQIRSVTIYNHADLRIAIIKLPHDIITLPTITKSVQ